MQEVSKYSYVRVYSMPKHIKKLGCEIMSEAEGYQEILLVLGRSSSATATCPSSNAHQSGVRLYLSLDSISTLPFIMVVGLAFEIL